MHTEPTKEVSLMFTGGLDTVLAAALLAQDFDRVHLLTYSNGFCLGINRLPYGRVVELRKVLGKDRFPRAVMQARDIFGELRRGLAPFIKKYNSPLILDLCCRLAMDTRTVIYNLEHGIRTVCDGNSKSQTEIFIQTEKYGKEIKRFMAEFGIEYLTPVFDFGDRDDKRRKLHEMGFEPGSASLTFLQRLGFNNFSEQFGRQPVCLLAPCWTTVLTSPLRDTWPLSHLRLSVDDAIAIRHDREEIARAYIERYFEMSSTNLDEFVGRLSEEQS